MAASPNIQYQVSLYRLCGELVTGLVDVANSGAEAAVPLGLAAAGSRCVPQVYPGCLRDLQSPDAAGGDIGGRSASFSSLAYHEEHLSLEEVGHSTASSSPPPRRLSSAKQAATTSNGNNAAGCFLCSTLDCDFDFQGPTTVPSGAGANSRDASAREDEPFLAEVKPRHEYISNVEYTEGARLCSGDLFDDADDDAHLHSSTSELSFEISFEPPLPGIYFAALHRREGASPSQQHKPHSPNMASDARFLLMRDVQCESKSRFFRVDTPRLQTNTISCESTDSTETRTATTTTAATTTMRSEECACCTVGEPSAGFKLCGDVIRAAVAASRDWSVGQSDSVFLQRFDWRSAGAAIGERCKHTSDAGKQKKRASPASPKSPAAEMPAFASAAVRGVPLPVAVEAHAWHRHPELSANGRPCSSTIPPDWLEKCTSDPSKKLWHIGFEDEHVRSDGSPSNVNGEAGSSCHVRGRNTCTVAIRAGSKTQKLPSKPGYYALLYRGTGASAGDGGHVSSESEISMVTFHVGLRDPRAFPATNPKPFESGSSEATTERDPVVTHNTKFQDFFEDALRQSRTLRDAADASSGALGQEIVWPTVAQQSLSTSKACAVCGCLQVKFEGSATPQQPGLYRLTLCTNGIPLAVSDPFFVGCVAGAVVSLGFFFALCSLRVSAETPQLTLHCNLIWHVCNRAPFIHPPSSANTGIDPKIDGGTALENSLWWNEDLVTKVVAGPHLDRRGTLELLEVDTREMPSLDDEPVGGKATIHQPQSTDANAGGAQDDPAALENKQVAHKDLDQVPLPRENLLSPPVCGCRVQLVAHNVSAHRLILCVATSPHCDATDFVAAYRVRAIRSRDTHEDPPRLYPGNADFVKGSECAVGKAEMLADDTKERHRRSRAAVALATSDASSASGAPAAAPLGDAIAGTREVVGAEPTSFKQAELLALKEDEREPESENVATDAQPAPYYRYGGCERVLDMPVKWLKMADGDYEVSRMSTACLRAHRGTDCRWRSCDSILAAVCIFTNQMRYIMCSKSSGWIFRSQYHCVARSFCQVLHAQASAMPPAVLRRV